MFDRRHINEVPTRQRDMRSNSCAFAGDRFLCDLDEYLLPLTKQVRDGRLRRTVASIPSVVSPASVAAGASIISPTAWPALAAGSSGLLRFFNNGSFHDFYLSGWHFGWNEFCLDDLVFLKTCLVGSRTLKSLFGFTVGTSATTAASATSATATNCHQLDVRRFLFAGFSVR